MDYGFEHNGVVYTPNGTAVSPADNAERNSAIERDVLRLWEAQPDAAVVYLPTDGSSAVTTWGGTRLGTLTRTRIYRHNFGGRCIAVRVLGTNGAMYYGRASYDSGHSIRLRRAKR